jgi:hypothetical protein
MRPGISSIANGGGFPAEMREMGRREEYPSLLI